MKMPIVRFPSPLELIGTLLWNFAEYCGFGYGKFSPVIFGWMIGSKGLKIK